MTTPFQWERSTAFSERIERLGLHGLHFQHVLLCERRAWMYLHGINFAQWHSRVASGTAKHQMSFARDSSTEGLFGLSPDRIDWEARVVYEDKGTGGAVNASNAQTAFYAVMLAIASGATWKSVTHVLSTRRNRPVPLDAEQLESLWQASERLEALASQHRIPPGPRIPLCETCSLASFCGHD